MDWFKGYIENIAVVLIFTGFIGLILPGGKYKGYIKLVTGLVVILVIISPVAKLLNSRGYEDLFKDAERELTMGIVDKERGFYDDAMLENVLAVYRSQLESQMAAKLQDFGFEIQQARIDIDEGEENFGCITAIELEIREIPLEEKTKFIQVDRVTIETIGKRSNGEPQEDSEEIKNIKSFLSDFYNLSVDNIYILSRR